MLEAIIRALDVEILNLEKSALTKPPDRNIPFHFGKMVGIRMGLQKARDAIQQISDEAEAAHEIRR